MGKTFTMFRERLSTAIRSLEKTRIQNLKARNLLEHTSIMLKDGKDKVSYLANLESVSKTRQLLYSPVKNLKLLWTTVRSLTSKDDRTKGDLIWFPVTKHLFSIQFVEAEKPFYQLGKGYVWECQCELFEYSDEEINTGIADLDAVETAFANAITVGLVAGGSGTFTAGETITGGTSNVTAEVKSFDAATRTLIVINRSGTFQVPETVTGGTSSASWTTATYNTIQNVNSEFDQNNDFETLDNDIIDFTESNPFGSVGSTTDTTI